MCLYAIHKDCLQSLPAASPAPPLLSPHSLSIDDKAQMEHEKRMYIYELSLVHSYKVICMQILELFLYATFRLSLALSHSCVLWEREFVFFYFFWNCSEKKEKNHQMWQMKWLLEWWQYIFYPFRHHHRHSAFFLCVRGKFFKFTGMGEVIRVCRSFLTFFKVVFLYHKNNLLKLKQ